MSSELPILHLIRDEQIPDGTFGRLVIGPSYGILHTCEDDWKNNERSISCIPAGTYALYRSIYWKHNYETFEVVGVPGRARILFHPGNTEEDTDGCILVGMRRGRLMVAKDEDTGSVSVIKEAVVDSRYAFGVFMSALAKVDQALLTVEWVDGLPVPVLA